VETVVSSSEFIVDDVNARNFNDKTFGSSVVLKSPIELHNAYFAAGVLAAAIFIVAVVVSFPHEHTHTQTYAQIHTQIQRPTGTGYIHICTLMKRVKGACTSELTNREIVHCGWEKCTKWHCIFICMF